VQVIKEGIGNKGPTLSTYISIAGRYLVLMPGMNRIGVSRKILDDDHRRKSKEIFNDLRPPKGLGFIIRTAGVGKSKMELQRDLAYLSRLWQVVARRVKKVKSPAEVFQESDIITRTIRDTFTTDIESIWVDDRAAFEHAQEFMHFVMPKYADRIKFHEGRDPLFHKFGIEEEITKMHQKKVPLPNGGSIIIEQTEALVAIDVNSGNFRTDGNNSEETAYQMNLAAAKEIGRQLRLRDLGGVIINDFIDMREEKHRRGVEKAMREAVRRDRARTKVLRISAFGLIEMTRQRIRPSLKRSLFTDCPACRSMGYVKTVESMSLEVLRLLQLATCKDTVRHVLLRLPNGVAEYLLNRKRKELHRLEELGSMNIEILGVQATNPEFLEITAFDQNRNEVRVLPQPTETTAPRQFRR
ncbi:MAG: Rne/Rng family ribonuclease, partial [Gemmataceae bacterium]